MCLIRNTSIKSRSVHINTRSKLRVRGKNRRRLRKWRKNPSRINFLCSRYRHTSFRIRKSKALTKGGNGHERALRKSPAADWGTISSILHGQNLHQMGGVKIMIQDILEKIIMARVYLKDRQEFTLGAKANKKTYEMLLIIFSSKVQDYEKRGNMYGERCSRNDHHSGIVYLKERPEFMLSAKTNKNFENCC